MDLARVNLTERAGFQTAILTTIASDQRPFAALCVRGSARLATAVACCGRYRDRSGGGHRRCLGSRRANQKALHISLGG